MTTDPAYYLNFGWLINNEIAGSRGPKSYNHLEFLRQQGVRALVRMSDEPCVTPDEIEQLGMSDCHEPVPDMKAPSTSQLEYMLGFIQRCLAEDSPVCVSCDGGYGRTATLLACYLVLKGLSAEEAIQQVKTKRPGSVLTPEQQKAVEEYSLRLAR